MYFTKILHVLNNEYLQDYVIGVMDLQRVKFQLKKKTTKIYQKPELTGNSLTPVVM